jgi:hypothetical protein
MKKILEFNRFLEDLILEKEEILLCFRLSDRLKELLKSIKNNSIADELLRSQVIEVETVITLIDLDDNNINNFIFTPSNKMYDYTKQQLSDNYLDLGYTTKSLFKHVLSTKKDTYYTKYKISASIGKVINKLYPNKFQPSGNPDNDIESFVNAVKAKRNIDFSKFKIVKGNDIVKYYLESNYDDRAFDGSSLGNSCMKYNSKSKYIEFYAKNPVELVILMSDKEENKIIGRALLWSLADLSEENSNYENNNLNRKFMDRIYTIYDYDVNIFKEFAEKNGWLYKTEQSMEHNEKIYDPLTKEENHIFLKTISSFVKNDGGYPFMDTLKWFYVNTGYLFNVEDKDKNETIYMIESTSGSYDVIQDIGDSDENTHEDEIYLDYLEEWYSIDDVIFCELGEEYRLGDDAIYVDYYEEYATRQYVNRYMTFSNYENSYLKNNDIVFSEYLNDYLSDNDSIEVYTTMNKKNVDYFPNDENNNMYITYIDIDEYGDEIDEYYKMKLVEDGYFTKVYIKLDKTQYIWLKTVEDKNKFFKWKSDYYLNDPKIKNEIGQLKLKLEKKINESLYQNDYQTEIKCPTCGSINGYFLGPGDYRKCINGDFVRIMNYECKNCGTIYGVDFESDKK